MPSLGNQDCRAVGDPKGSLRKKVRKGITEPEKRTTYFTTKSTKDTKNKHDDFLICCNLRALRVLRGDRISGLLKISYGSLKNEPFYTMKFPWRLNTGLPDINETS
jgi:hypothetical protein